MAQLTVALHWNDFVFHGDSLNNLTIYDRNYPMLEIKSEFYALWEHRLSK